MKKAVLLLAFCVASGPAFATCKADADAKHLAGAARTSFMTKCEKDAKAACEADSNSKRLAGAARTSHMTKCVADAVGS
jgi:psiF repeat-containing protein